MADIIKESVYPFVTHGGIHDHQCFAPGITKREYYAALAMQGMSANPVFDNAEPETIAKCAVIQADALIAALEAKGDE